MRDGDGDGEEEDGSMECEDGEYGVDWGCVYILVRCRVSRVSIVYSRRIEE